MGGALDEPGVLQRVDQAGDIARRALEQLAELSLGARTGAPRKAITTRVVSSRSPASSARAA